MKRVFGLVEAVFDVFYLVTASIIGAVLLSSSKDDLPRMLSGIMALVLVLGDAFHLLPRIKLILTGREELKRALGRGKQVTSITMTIFYVILWHVGLLVFSPQNMRVWTYAVYFLALTRIMLCLLPQNKWEERFPPVRWGIWRNIPFAAQGILVAALFYMNRNAVYGLGMGWLAILLSFIFYLPVVFWANKIPKIGMLMLPKSCAYLWLLAMCLSM